VVRQRSAKPSFAGSIPAVASISVPRNFSFEPTVLSHGWYLLAPFRWLRPGKALRRAEVSGGKAVDLTITFSPPRAAAPHAAPHLRVEGVSDSPELRTKITRMFQLKVDTAEFVSRTRDSPPHAWVEAAGFGRLLCASTLFEDVVKIITTTNTMWRQTMRMCELLCQSYGRRSPDGHAAFPEPSDLARIKVDALQQRCRLGYRAKSIHALAKGISDGSLDLPRISDPSQTTEELFASYRTLPGIGPYGAAHLLAMDGRHDFIAVDTEFRRFVRETYHGGRAIKDSTMLRRYTRWGRWKYLAYWSELWNQYRAAERLQPLERGDK
jgi:3-methyladenine DNA glycosylase/8-oxoguanine DNA glycosylase